MTTSLPALPFDADDAPWPEGELTALAVPAGPEVSLQFPSPFEPFLVLDGARVVEDRGPATRRLLLWLGRRMPALWRALDERFALRGVLGASGVVVHDFIDLQSGALADHGLMRERLEQAQVQMPPFAVLGGVSTKNELVQRARSMFAAGAVIEVRVEEAGIVLSRRRVRLER
jgi:hypothetical protein